jgi:hypothetical protein
MTRPTPQPDFYPAATVATLLGISTRQVHRLRAAGELDAVWIGGRVVIPRVAYEDYRARLLAPRVIQLPRRGRPRQTVTQ